MTEQDITVSTIYVSIGNSDDKLTQAEWATFCASTLAEIKTWSRQIHGDWHSLPNARWQNMCICFEVDDTAIDYLKTQLAKQAERYRQDSIAWAPAQTEFLRPTEAPEDEDALPPILTRE